MLQCTRCLELLAFNKAPSSNCPTAWSSRDWNGSACTDEQLHVSLHFTVLVCRTYQVDFFVLVHGEELFRILSAAAECARGQLRNVEAEECA